MKLASLFPAASTVEAAELLADVSEADLVVGDERIRDFLVALGRRLLAPSLARRWPELGSLGFFLRRGELDRALSTVVEREGELRFPRGLVFHLPPANVDTIFVYSWALAALAGNRNVVRISSRSAGAADAVLEALNEASSTVDSAVATVVSRTQRMVSYGHDDAVTASLSAACDLRVLWGGDESVTRLRQHPLPPASRDLTFPDRSSFTVLSAAGWAGAAAAARRALAEGLYNDIYWFDQAACASPRALFWVGSAASVAAAQAELVEELAAVVAARRPEVDAAMAVQKHVSAYGLAAEGAATRIRFHGNEISTVELSTVDAVPRHWLGTGTLVQARVDHLLDLVPLIQRRDQTLTHFGFDAGELLALARALGGRGVDRLVPVGQALTFATVWDGYDLLREFTRLVTVTVPRGIR